MSESQSPEPSSDRQKDHRRPVLIGLLAVVVLLAVGAVFLLRQDAEDARDDTSAAGESSSIPASEESSAESSAPTTTVPPTEPTEPSPTEAAPTEATTPAPTDAEQSAEAAPAGVSVLVTSQQYNPSSGAIEVVGAVQGAATQTSTCTAVATMGTAEVTAGVSGVFDGTGTSCGLIEIPMAGQPGGTWSVAITFQYAGGAVTSAPVQVNVPG